MKTLLHGDVRLCVNLPLTQYSQDVGLYVRKLRLDYYTANGQWEIVDTAADDIIVNGVRIIQFQLELRRRRFFYVLNVILPVQQRRYTPFFRYNNDVICHSSGTIMTLYAILPVQQ